MLAIQTYLQQNSLNPAQLREELGIKVRNGLDGRVLLKYDKFDNKWYKFQETRECRGLILNYHEDFKVLAYPFYKFFNHFESLAAPIDWSTARAYQKFDGTCISIYPFLGTWRLSTLGSLNCEGPVDNNLELTFYDLAFPLFKEIRGKLNPSYTYVFELCSKLNRIVTLYDHSFLKLIMVRDAESLEEIPIEKFGGSLDIAPSWKVNSLEEVVEMANGLKNLEEGYVVKDAEGNRIKVKSDTYFSAFSIKNELSASFASMVKFILMENYEEFLHIFPEYKSEFTWCACAINALIGIVTNLAAGFDDRKALAIAVRDQPALISNLCFYAFSNPKADLRKVMLENLNKKPNTAKWLYIALTHLVGEPQWKRT